MKAVYWAAAVIGAASCAGTAWGAAGQAEARLSCSSVRMHRGSGAFGLYTLDISSDQPPQSPNGELGPFSQNYSHVCYFALNDPSGFDPMTGIMHLDVPLDADANEDGFSDFFEVSEEGSGDTTGVYSIPGVVSSGSVTARWTRGAGGAQGTCVITLQNLGDFTHSFEILEYNGLLRYQPGTNTVAGTIQLAQAGLAENLLGGVIEFQKVSSNPYNRVQLKAGNWTNSNSENLAFGTELIEREPSWPTNYYGYVTFDNDSDPASFYPYAEYLLSIDDMNDRDNDGVPDFSDEPSGGTRAPRLALRSTSTALLLTITGDAGTVCGIEEANSAAGGAWQTIRTVTLSSGTHEVELPLPAGPAAFWRARVQ